MGDLWAKGGIKAFYNGLDKNHFRRSGGWSWTFVCMLKNVTRV